MWLTLIGLLIILWLLMTAYNVLPRAVPPPSLGDTSEARPPYYDTDFLLKETDTQRREGAWVGFLQEDVYKDRTGPIGDFVGNDSPSGKAPLYFIA